MAEGRLSRGSDLCREKLKELEKHEPKPLPPDVAAIQKETDTLLKMKK